VCFAFLRDTTGIALVKWRVDHLTVNDKGERELDFYEDLALPVGGISQLQGFD